jgi:hypothetical protein
MIPLSDALPLCYGSWIAWHKQLSWLSAHAVLSSGEYSIFWSTVRSNTFSEMGKIQFTDDGQEYEGGEETT